jgi:hypothetical protein
MSGNIYDVIMFSERRRYPQIRMVAILTIRENDNPVGLTSAPFLICDVFQALPGEDTAAA